MFSVIGGQMIFGGWIQQSSTNQAIGNTAPWNAYGYQRGIPIRQCRVLQEFHETPLLISGLLGAPTSRRDGFRCAFSFNIWFDTGNPLEPYGTGIPSFRQRDPFQLVFLLGYDPTTNLFARSYYAPIAVCDKITPIWNEESDPRQCIGEEVAGHTRGWTFMLPDDGNPSDATTVVGAYVNYIRNLGANLL